MMKRKGCMIVLWVIGCFFVLISWLVLTDWKDRFGIVLYRANDTTVIAQISSSAYCLTALKGEYDNDTLVLHSYGKFMYFTFLKSRRGMYRGVTLEHPVQYVRFRDELYPFGKLHVWRFPDRMDRISFRKIKDK